MQLERVTMTKIAIIVAAVVCCVLLLPTHVAAVKWSATTMASSMPTCLDNGDATSQQITYDMGTPTLGALGFVSGVPTINNLLVSVKFNKIDDGTLSGTQTSCITTNCNTLCGSMLCTTSPPFYDEIQVSLATASASAKVIPTGCYMGTSGSNAPGAPWTVTATSDPSVTAPLCGVSDPSSGTFQFQSGFMMSFVGQPAITDYSITFADTKKYDPLCAYGVVAFSVWPALMITGSEVKQVSCTGGSDAKWSLTVTGGMGPSYKLNVYQTSLGSATGTAYTATVSGMVPPAAGTVMVSGLQAVQYTVDAVDLSDSLSVGSWTFTPTEPRSEERV